MVRTPGVKQPSSVGLILMQMRAHPLALVPSFVHNMRGALMNESSSKTALITGGHGTLARATAQRLRADGWQVLAPGRDELDVSSSEKVRSFFVDLTQIDLLICLAGCIDDVPLTRMEADQFERVLDVNLHGVFRCAREWLWLMAKRRCGHLITVGSFAALRGTAGQANYAAAKAALIGFTKAIALEYGTRGLRANCVLPGLLETRMTEQLLSDPEKRRELEEQHALRRFNTVEDAARFIVFLDSMSRVSGQVFQLDSRVGRWA